MNLLHIVVHFYWVHYNFAPKTNDQSQTVKIVKPSKNAKQ